MNVILVATLTGIFTAICWGVGDWLSAKVAKKFDPFQINFGVSYVNLFIIAGLLLFADTGMPTNHQLLAIITASVCISSAYMLFVKALKDGPVGIIVPLGNSYPLITIGLSIVLLSQAFNALQVGAMVGIVAGAALLAYQKNRRQIPLKELHKDTMLAAMAAVIWGTGFFALNSVVDELGWQTIALFMEITLFCVAFLAVLATRRSNTLTAIRQISSNKTVLIAGCVGGAGFISFYLGSDYAKSAVIPTVLSGCGPLIAAGLGAVYDHEKLGATKRAGAVLVVAGIVVLNLA